MEDRQRILDLYEGRLAEFGHDVRTVGWSSKADQWLRFSVLCRGLALDGKRILDVGCGLGDFVDFLESRGCENYRYVGLDISSKLIHEAETKFGDERRQFVSGDLLDGLDLGTFDIVVSSGALSFRIADNIGLARQMMAAMFGLTREALAVNFLTSYVDYQLPKNFHYEPEQMFALARSMTRFVRLHHDYPLYEFTLQLFREHQQGPLDQVT